MGKAAYLEPLHSQGAGLDQVFSAAFLQGFAGILVHVHVLKIKLADLYELTVLQEFCLHQARLHVSLLSQRAFSWANCATHAGGILHLLPMHLEFEQEDLYGLGPGPGPITIFLSPSSSSVIVSAIKSHHVLHEKPDIPGALLHLLDLGGEIILREKPVHALIS